MPLGSSMNNVSWMQVLKTQLTAKGMGYSDVLYLDAVENKYVEEVSSCNIFMVKVCAIAGWCNWFNMRWTDCGAKNKLVSKDVVVFSLSVLFVGGKFCPLEHIFIYLAL